jgi:hypothetical protein
VDWPPERPRRNKANSSRCRVGRGLRDVGPGGKCAKRTQFSHGQGHRPGESCETNPNSAGRPGAIVRNKPNSGRGQEMASAWWRRIYGRLAIRTAPAKQSQFPAMPDGTGPGTWGKCAKRSQFRRLGRGRTDGNRGTLYKQSQSVPVSGNGRGPAGATPPAGPIAQNEPNSWPAGRDGAWGTRGVTQPCKTNPICRWRAGKTIAKAFGLDDATRHRGNDAKRTQFPPGEISQHSTV